MVIFKLLPMQQSRRNTCKSTIAYTWDYLWQLKTHRNQNQIGSGMFKGEKNKRTRTRCRGAELEIQKCSPTGPSTWRLRNCPFGGVWWAGKFVLLIHVTNSLNQSVGKESILEMKHEDFMWEQTSMARDLQGRTSTKWPSCGQSRVFQAITSSAVLADFPLHRGSS